MFFLLLWVRYPNGYIFLFFRKSSFSLHLIICFFRIAGLCFVDIHLVWVSQFAFGYNGILIYIGYIFYIVLSTLLIFRCQNKTLLFPCPSMYFFFSLVGF